MTTIWRRLAESASSADDPVAGQGLVEYSLILLFVALAVIGALTLFGTTLSATYTAIRAVFP